MTGVDRSTLLQLIQLEWICPVATDELDQEDVARIHLIQELRSSFGVNEEAIPLILHLVDQLYFLRNQMKKLGKTL
jgi:chaperone modulatory protein CbpM